MATCLLIFDFAFAVVMVFQKEHTKNKCFGSLTYITFSAILTLCLASLASTNKTLFGCLFIAIPTIITIILMTYTMLVSCCTVKPAVKHQPFAIIYCLAVTLVITLTSLTTKWRTCNIWDQKHCLSKEQVVWQPVVLFLWGILYGFFLSYDTINFVRKRKVDLDDPVYGSFAVYADLLTCGTLVGAC